jgi:hypothetical protein
MIKSLIRHLVGWKDKAVPWDTKKTTSELPPFDEGKKLFLAWKEGDPHFDLRWGLRCFSRPKGSPSHPCPVCKDKPTWHGKPCGPCRRDSLNIWCPCPKPVSDYIVSEYCIRCGLDIKELWDLPEYDTPEDEAVYEKYEKMSNYHLHRWQLKCKIEAPEFKAILADRIIAEDKHQAEYLLEEALSRLGETTSLRETNPESLKMDNWEVVNLGVLEFGWQSRTSIFER